MAAPNVLPISGLLILDSIAYVERPNVQIENQIIVTGSHGGTAAAGYLLDHSQRPRLVFFNDAGGGKDRAGLAGLNLLQDAQLAACTYSHWSARIGQAQDGLEHGVISHCNALASALGLLVGSPVRTAIATLLKNSTATANHIATSELSQGKRTIEAGPKLFVEPNPCVEPNSDVEPNPYSPPLRQFRDPNYESKAENLAELRTQIDSLDESIISLIAERAMLVKDAARFKANHFQVSAPQRQAEVFARARQRAMRHNRGFEGFEEVVEQTYRTMVAQFIAKESLYFDQLIAI
jgi:isochorismate pyruvate lyase